MASWLVCDNCGKPFGTTKTAEDHIGECAEAPTFSLETSGRKFNQSKTTEHVILVAFVVEAETMQKAQEEGLFPRLTPILQGRSGGPIVEWWVAEDERYDGSDCDTAEFVRHYYNPRRER
jgi:hypothetical protein